MRCKMHCSPLRYVTVIATHLDRSKAPLILIDPGQSGNAEACVTPSGYISYKLPIAFQCHRMSLAHVINHEPVAMVCTSYHPVKRHRYAKQPGYISVEPPVSHCQPARRVKSVYRPPIPFSSNPSSSSRTILRMIPRSKRSMTNRRIWRR